MTSPKQQTFSYIDDNSREIIFSHEENSNIPEFEIETQKHILMCLESGAQIGWMTANQMNEEILEKFPNIIEVEYNGSYVYGKHENVTKLQNGTMKKRHFLSFIGSKGITKHQRNMVVRYFHYSDLLGGMFQVYEDTINEPEKYTTEIYASIATHVRCYRNRYPNARVGVQIDVFIFDGVEYIPCFNGYDPSFDLLAETMKFDMYHDFDGYMANRAARLAYEGISFGGWSRFILGINKELTRIETNKTKKIISASGSQKPTHPPENARKQSPSRPTRSRSRSPVRNQNEKQPSQQ